MIMILVPKYQISIIWKKQIEALEKKKINIDMNLTGTGWGK